MEFDLKRPQFDEPDPDRIFWYAIGWVEGYTCAVERKLEFVSDGARVKPGIYLGQAPSDVERADRIAYHMCPLWAPFREWEASHARSWHAAADRAVAEFLE